MLESSPTKLHKGTTLEKIMNLRPRDKDKEIGPASFRFQAKSGVERIYDSLMARNTGALPLNEIIDPKTMKRLKLMK